MKKTSLIVSLLIILLTLSSCTSETLDGGSKNDDDTPLISLTMDEIAMYNGKDGNQAYIVVQGVIYDVTEEWNNGSHNGVSAGTDATTAIMNAPHGESILDDLTIIGNVTVEDEPTTIQLTLTELAQYNGQDGMKAYIAVSGIIYDVTDEWGSTTHNGVTAGTDATTAISSAPHGLSVLSDLEIIGELIEE